MMCRLLLLGVVELAWNTYPSTDFSSASLHVYVFSIANESCLVVHGLVAINVFRPVASLMITWIVSVRFWTFSEFENWSSQWLFRGHLDFKNND